MKLNETILRQIILDHYNNPRLKGLPKNPSSKTIHANSESCIDDLTIEVKVENGIVKEVNFDGVACAICTSSTDIVGLLVIGKKISEANIILKEYYRMILNEPFNEEILAEAIAFRNIHMQPTRTKCATLGVNAINKLINERNNDER